MAEHQHRMEQDGTRWRATLRYGRNIRKFWRNEINRAVIAELDPRPGETVLDIGAGMGAGVFPVGAAVGAAGRVIAIEPTPFMRRLLQARRTLSRQRGRIRVVDAVAEDLGVASDSVDAAFAVNVLHHVSDLTGMARELQRVVRPGGRVLLLDEDFDDPSHPNHEEMQARHGHHHGGDHHHGVDEDGHHHLMVDVAAVAATLREHGFEAEARAERLADRPVRRVDARLTG